MKLAQHIIISSIAFTLGCAGCGGMENTASQPFSVIGDCPADLPEGSSCLSQAVPPDAQPPEQGGCWVTGIGTFGKGVTRDSFGGNAMTMKDGSVRGEWQHVDHFDVSGQQKNGQNLFHGKVEYITCKRFPTLNGPQVPKAEPNYARWGGHGRFNGVDGYSFEVQAFDHAEGGIFRDRYAIVVRDAAGVIVLEADGNVTRSITNGPEGSMNQKGQSTATPPTKGNNGQAKGKDTAPTTSEPPTANNPRDTSCREDPTITTAEFSWVADLGCISGGNFQIHPPNKGHPY